MYKVAIIGQQCAGKTSVANIIEDMHGSAKVVKFAQPIYDTLEVFGQAKHRAFMQGLGDLAKDNFGRDVYAEIFKRNVEKLTEEDDYEILICDDCRYDFEFETAKKLGFKFIFVEAEVACRRQRARDNGYEFIEQHNSETGVANLRHLSDAVVENNLGDKQILKKDINAIVHKTLWSSFSTKPLDEVVKHA